MTAFALMNYLNYKNEQIAKQNECCGIVGYIGNQQKAGDICIKGLHILESRGYDSCGIVSIDSKTK